MTTKLLVIEDDPATSRLLTIALKRKNHEVLNASNGLEGLHLARTEMPSLILLDLMLPGIDGFEVLNQLKKSDITAPIPVIVVSAKSQATDKELAKKLGAANYLTKPYRIQELIACVEELTLKEPSPARLNGHYILVVGPRPAEATAVTVYTGVALAKREQPVTIADLRPYSSEHLLTLNMSPSPSPTNLPQSVQHPQELLDLAVQHASGLKLLSGLVGNGEVGQFTVQDGQILTAALQEAAQLALIDVPLHPPQQIRTLSKRSALILLVTEDQPAALAATHTTLNLLRQLEVPEDKLAFVIIGDKIDRDAETLGLPILERLPKAINEDTSLDALADQILKRIATPE